MSPLADYKCDNCLLIDYDVLYSDPMDMMLSYRCPRCTIGMMHRMFSSPNFTIKGHSSKNGYNHNGTDE